MADERTNGEGIIGGRDDTGQPRAGIVPKTTERPTPSREQCRSLLAPLSCSMTVEPHTRVDQCCMERIEQGKHTRRQTQDHAQQRETRLHGLHTRTFQRHVACRRANTGCTLPTPPRGENDLPRLCFCVNRLIGTQRHDPLVHARFHQKQVVPGFRMAKSRPPAITRHLLSCLRLPSFLLRSIRLSLSHLPALRSLSCTRHTLVSCHPASPKTSAIRAHTQQPLS